MSVKAGGDDDLPPELQTSDDDDGKFAKIDQGDPAYGPPALLLFGFTPDEKQDVKGLLDEIGGDFMKIVQATSDMLDGTLWDAFGRVQVQTAQNLATDVPRMCFISGLTGEELMMLVDAFGKSKLQRPVFAALVPKNKDKLLRELIDEVMGDHRRLVIERRKMLREQQAKTTG